MPSRPFALLIATLTLAGGGSASAHAHLASATPAVDGTVKASPAAVRVVFSEPVVASFSGLELMNAKGGRVALGKAATDPKDAHALAAPVKASLAPGAYTVRWHAVSADTHRVSGQYRFSVAP